MTGGPSPKRRCVFCGEGPLSAEHVFPEWIAELFREHVGTGDWGHSNSALKKVWFKPRLDVTAKFVCKGCNSGWLSEIENDAKPVLAPLILGRGLPVLLSLADQRVLAYWAFKTALTASLVSDKKLFGPEPFAELYRRKAPPPLRTVIWTAGYNSGRPESSIRPRTGRIVVSAYPTQRAATRFETQSRLITVSIYWFVFQVLQYDGYSIPGRAFAQIRGIKRIWPLDAPTDGPFEWPPDRAALGKGALERFAHRSDNRI